MFKKKDSYVFYFFSFFCILSGSICVGFATSSFSWVAAAYFFSLMTLYAFKCFSEMFCDLNQNISTVADCLKKALDDDSNNSDEITPEEE